MSYVDAHLHLAEREFSDRIEQALQDADENNVRYLLSSSMDYDSSTRTIALAKQYGPKVQAVVGTHPWTATKTEDVKLDKFEDLIETNREYVTAIGEIGLDGKYTQDRHLKEKQEQVFRFFLELAERDGLPVVVHSRLALNEVLVTLSEFHLSRVLLHWYDGPVDKLSDIREKGYMISIGPAVLYSEPIIEIARQANLDMIITETDAPVTYRGPFKGKPTQPSFVVQVVKRLAELKGLSIADVRTAIWGNVLRYVPSLT